MFENSGSVEEVVSALPKDQSQFLIVISHHFRLEDLLGEGHEPVDILHCFVGLLPQLHLDGGIQLT